MADQELADARRVKGPERAGAARIRVNGIVQGVGFRPFIYGLALEKELAGWVRNTSAGVDIVVEGPVEGIESFIKNIESQAPPLADIEAVNWQWEQMEGYQEFNILHSQHKAGDFQPISPDVSLCPDCRAELFDPADRRYRYPFINCTNCGPRFTIIRGLPYDRPATTMASFELCEPCRSEYLDPLDRRFHAQPIACPDCGPQVWLERSGQQTDRRDQAIRTARDIVAKGGLLALKGLGGFQLICDATRAQAVTRLRELKARQHKPFAVMVPDIAAAEAVCHLNPEERELLLSKERPIVLLSQRPGAEWAASVAPGQSTLGLMLPYTPLHELLLEREAGHPDYLIMTSANRPGEPIVHLNEQARQLYQHTVDAIVLHDRPIEQRCDDSVYRIAMNDLYPLRRARGYAPYPVRLASEGPSILAVGAELKNTFCLTKGSHAFLSQHIGDLSNYETLQAYEDTLSHFQSIFQIEPEAIAFDLHPDYLSTQFALETCQKKSIAAVPIQHHHAHIASCLAEHQHDNNEPVIGFAFDGTGYGPDGAIWGGEVLITNEKGYERAFHLRYVPMAGAEQAVRQPWRLALAWLQLAGIEWEADLPPLAEATQQERSIVHQQLEQGINAPLTSSMGRLFDAVSSLAGIRQQVTFEGQAAMELEAAADPDTQGSYFFDLHQDIIDPTAVIHQVAQDVTRGLKPGAIATRFHRGLANAVLETANRIRQERGINVVALSGGVWQNQLLLRMTVELLRQAGFEVLLHRQVPANDGGLSLGQAWLASEYLRMGLDSAAIAAAATGNTRE